MKAAKQWATMGRHLARDAFLEHVHSPDVVLWGREVGPPERWSSLHGSGLQHATLCVWMVPSLDPMKPVWFSGDPHVLVAAHPISGGGNVSLLNCYETKDFFFS